MAVDTLSRRKALRIWGWGYEEDNLTPEEEAGIRASVSALSPSGFKEVAAPSEDEFDLVAPRFSVPNAFEQIFSATRYDRLTHAYGKSSADTLRLLMRQVPHAPDYVAFPKSENDVQSILDWAADANVAVIPFGGGTSVCGGVEADVGDAYAGTVSLDMQYFDKVLEIDRTSRAARIQAGLNGIEVESLLRPHGLTLRHFPQSFQFSTVGGWIATRAGGHYASLYTHIDDFVESIRMVTPQGTMESRRLPGSGAGPSADRMMIGSEGMLGVITESWLRLQDRPTFRGSASVQFDDFSTAVQCVRALSQSALFPTNCRLLDQEEVRLNGVGDGNSPVLVLGFESADHPLDAWMGRALELVCDHGGRYDKAAAARSLDPKATGDAEHTKGAAGEWRNAFLRMPYYRNLSMRLGLIGDTFESAITWDHFDHFYAETKERMGKVMREITGGDNTISCRFTHIYPDGPAPYFTFRGLGSCEGDLASVLSKWKEIKIAANETTTALGGTVTHHHAVGRDHRPGYEVQTSPLFRQALQGAKQSLDPQGIMNPGVLIDPRGKEVGIRGILK